MYTQCTCLYYYHPLVYLYRFDRQFDSDVYVVLCALSQHGLDWATTLQGCLTLDRINVSQWSLVSSHHDEQMTQTLVAEHMYGHEIPDTYWYSKDARL